MALDTVALDRFLTTEPDNGYISFIEKIWAAISEDEISGEEYDKYEDFFSYWENKLSMSGTNPNGFPSLSFCIDCIKMRYRRLKYLLCNEWVMENPDLFIDPVTGKKHRIHIAFEIAYSRNNSLKTK